MPQYSYLIGLGSNIDPANNMVRIVTSLLDFIDTLHISRVINIPPVGMNSHHDFLNAVIFFESDLSADEIKSRCNTIEIKLGRDRQDPDRKIKDRVADIDILCMKPLADILQKPLNQLTDEYFLYPVIEELRAYLAQQTLPRLQVGEPLQLKDLSFGESATTIYRQARTSDEWVLQQAFHR